LPIWVVKNGIRVRRTKPPRSLVERGRLAAAPSMISGRFAFKIISAARSIACHCASGSSTGCEGTISASPSSDAMSSGSSRRTGPGRSSVATRNASRTIVGIEEAETICRAILVTGRIELITSTIWNFACRQDRMPF
jgi:hypothetical protein